MNEQLEFYPIGTEVTMKLTEHKGVILSFQYSGTISYEVRFNNAGTYNTIWCKDFEFMIGGDVKKQFGFGKECGTK